MLIASGFRVFGGVRERADADRLSREFGAEFMPIIFDVIDEAPVTAGAKQVEAASRGRDVVRAHQQCRGRRAGTVAIDALLVRGNLRGLTCVY